MAARSRGASSRALCLQVCAGNALGSRERPGACPVRKGTTPHQCSAKAPELRPLQIHYEAPTWYPCAEEEHPTTENEGRDLPLRRSILSICRQRISRRASPHRRSVSRGAQLLLTKHSVFASERQTALQKDFPGYLPATAAGTGTGTAALPGAVATRPGSAHNDYQFPSSPDPRDPLGDL